MYEALQRTHSSLDRNSTGGCFHDNMNQDGIEPGMQDSRWQLSVCMYGVRQMAMTGEKDRSGDCTLDL